MRILLPIALTLASGICSGVDLDSACGSLAPTAEVRVSFLPAAAQIDDTKRAREIKFDGDKAGAFRQLGVTRATLVRDVDVRLEGFADDRHACAWPKVTLKLSVRPLLVELARELEANECMRVHVLEHEMQHVAIYNASALRAALQLEQEMRAHFSARQLDGAADTLLETVQAQIRERWLSRLDALLAEADREHDALDAAEERQAYKVCDGALSRMLKGLE